MKIFPKQASLVFPLFLAGICPSLALEVSKELDEGTAASPTIGTLRYAVLNTPTGGTVTFAAALSGKTVHLSSATLDITRSMTIDGSSLAEGIRITGEKTPSFPSGNRVIKIHPSVNVTLRSLTISGGYPSGLDVATGAGGGILVDHATATLTDCTVSGNSASFGGGIYVDGSDGVAKLTLNSSTVSGNNASSGGGIYISGIDSGSAVVNIDSSTISQNSADSGGGMTIVDTATVVFTSCTVSGNFANSGGGISSAGKFGTASLEIRNSIVADNFAATGPDFRDQFSTLKTVEGFNLVSSLSGSAGLTAGPRLSVQAALRLAPLGSYGGQTQTMPPLAGSPAINVISPAGAGSFDQRGFSRSVGGSVDVGAVELQNIVTVTNTSDAGAGSLRDTLANATASLPGTVIRFTPSLTEESIKLDSTHLEIPATANGLFLDASNLTTGMTISAGGNATSPRRAVRVNPGATVAFHGFTFTDGYQAGGGAIFNHLAKLTLNGCILTGNRSTQGGGAVANVTSGNPRIRCELTLNQSTAWDNQADSAGGAISSYAVVGKLSSVTLYRSTLTGNLSAAGGAILNIEDRDGVAGLSITSSTITNNTATLHGGGVQTNADVAPGVFLSESKEAVTVIANSIIAGNLAPSFVDYYNVPGTLVNYRLVGKNIFSNRLGTDIPPGHPTLIVAPPHLSNLGMYGGKTPVMIPLPGSAAENGTTIASGSYDQRGNRAVGVPDIGAVEYRGAADLPFLLNSDTDKDGSPFGVELAIGSNPLVADTNSLRNLRISRQNGQVRLNFGIDQAQESSLILRLKRSTDLVSFPVEIAGNTSTFFSGPGGTGALSILDSSPPPGGKAFYRLEATAR